VSEHSDDGDNGEEEDMRDV